MGNINSKIIRFLSQVLYPISFSMASGWCVYKLEIFPVWKFLIRIAIFFYNFTKYYVKVSQHIFTLIDWTLLAWIHSGYIHSYMFIFLNNIETFMVFIGCHASAFKWDLTMGCEFKTKKSLACSPHFEQQILINDYQYYISKKFHLNVNDNTKL